MSKAVIHCLLCQVPAVTQDLCPHHLQVRDRMLADYPVTMVRRAPVHRMLDGRALVYTVLIDKDYAC